MNLALAAAAGLLGMGCLLLFDDLSTERMRVRALEVQVAQLQSDLKRPQRAHVNEDKARAIEQLVKTAVPQPAAAAPSRTAASKSTPADTSADRARERRILADPSYQATAHAHQLLEVQSEHPQLASELGMSKEQTAGFLDLLADQRLREGELGMHVESGEDWEQWLSALYEQQDKDRRQFLGEQRYQAWNDYVKSAPTRALVSELRTQLATSSSPLREEQIKPLVKALAAEQQRHQAERGQNYGDAQWTEETPVAERVAYMERRAELVDQSVARSKELGTMYLDSTQQRTLDALLERQSKRARAELASTKAYWEAEERQKTAAGSR
jgi:hypothetical protein